MRTGFLAAALALAAACGDGATPPEEEKEPPISVEATVTVRQGVPAVCTIAWKAVASKPGVVVHYAAGLDGYSVGNQGEFTDSVKMEWQWGGPFPVTVAWFLTSGAWSKGDRASVSGC